MKLAALLLWFLQKHSYASQEQMMCFSCATEYFENDTRSSSLFAALPVDRSHIQNACTYNPVAYHMPIDTCSAEGAYCYSMEVHQFELSWWDNAKQWLSSWFVNQPKNSIHAASGSARGCWPTANKEATFRDHGMDDLTIDDQGEVENDHWCSVKIIRDSLGLPLARIKWCFCHKSLCNRRCNDGSVDRCFHLNTTTPPQTTTIPHTSMETLVPANYTMATLHPSVDVASSCLDWFTRGYKDDGLYNVTIGTENGEILEVYCDMTSPGGGWMVFQRRNDNLISFSRNWTEYENGFGTIDNSSDFWLGLKYLHPVTSSHEHYLLVEMTNCTNDTARQLYNHFEIGGPDTGYRLSLTEIVSTGGAGDSLRYEVNDGNGTEVNGFWNLDGMQFRTYDADNDCGCAKTLGGGWWFNCCAVAYLNGGIHNCSRITTRELHNLLWITFSNPRISLQGAEMKVRPRLPCDDDCFTIE